MLFLRPPVSSDVLRRTPEDLMLGSSRSGGADGFDGIDRGGAGGGDPGASGDAFHPSHCFYSPKDLTLSDDCPFAVFEYTEQQPIVLNNPGMSIRVTRYVRPLTPPPQAAAAGSNIQGSLKAERTRAEETRLQVYGRLLVLLLLLLRPAAYYLLRLMFI